MNRSVIFIIVIMVFAYIIGKYKLLPYLAAKKILKDAKKGGTDNGSTPAPVPPAQTPYSMPYVGYPFPMAQPQPQPEKPSRRDMYVNHLIINTDVGSPGDIDLALDGAIAELLLMLRDRGICPDSFNIVPLGGSLLLAYVTYTI